MFSVMLFNSNQALSQSTTKDKADYKPAIEKLLSLGFPNARGAKFVKLSTDNLDYSYSDYNFVSHYDDKPGIAGNGFYIPNKDASKPGRFILIGGLEFTYTKKRGERYNSDNELILSGKMKNVDIKKDIKKLQTWLLRQVTSNDSDWRYYGTQEASVVLAIANLAYHSGYQKEATDLMNTLFINHDDPEEIIDALIDRVATTQYERVFTKFEKSGDWKAYLTALQTLQKKFPRGWDDQAGLAILIPRVKDRAEGKLAPIPEIADHTFSPEILKLIKSSADFKSNPDSPNAYYSVDPLFLINKQEANKNASPLDQLTYHGMDGFIALVALMDDRVLMPSSNESYSDMSGFSSDDPFGSGFGARGVSGESALDAYENLSKPSTRGEQASSLVKNALPLSKEETRDLPVKQLQTLALDWWKRHRNFSKIELTKVYLQNTDSPYMVNLANSLITQNTDESIALLEKSILSSETPSSFYNIVKSLIVKRREKAADFLNQYEKNLREEIGEATGDEYISSGQYSIKQKGGTKKFIAKLRRYTQPLDINQLLTNLAKKDAKTADILEQLAVALNTKELSEFSAKFVYAAAKTKDKKKRNLILNSLQKLAYKDDGADALDADEPNAKPTPKLSKYELQDWRKLLSIEDEQAASYYGSVSTQQRVAIIISKLFHSAHSYAEITTLQRYLTAEEYKTLLITRANDLLDGKKVSPIPSADDVSENRLQEITKNFASFKPIEIRPALEKLTISERLAISEVTDDIESLQKAAKHILGFSSYQNLAKMPEAKLKKIIEHLTTIIGEKHDAKTAEKIAQLALENSDDFAGFTVSITSGMILPGYEFYISPITLQAHDKLTEMEKKIKAGSITAFSMVATHDYNSSETTSFAYSPKESAKISDIETFWTTEDSNPDNLMIFTQNKEKLAKIKAEREANKDKRKKMLDEIYKIYPSLKDSAAAFDALPFDTLKEYYDQTLKQAKENEKTEEDEPVEEESLEAIEAQ